MAVDWILGLGLMFGIALALTLLTKTDYQIGLIVFMFMGCALLVYATILPEWVLIVMLMFVIIFIYFKISRD